MLTPSRSIRFREALRLAAARRNELLAATRPIRRITLTAGPVLSLVALWIVHDMDALPADSRIGFVLGLFAAPLAIGLMFELPAHLSRIPKLAPIMLHRWHVTSRGVIFQTTLSTGGAPWSAVELLEIERSGDELTLHLTVNVRGTYRRHSLTCARAEIGDEALATFTDAVNRRRYPEAAPVGR